MIITKNVGELSSVNCNDTLVQFQKKKRRQVISCSNKMFLNIET